MIPEYYTAAQVADILSISKETLKKWGSSGKLKPYQKSKLVYHRSQIEHLEPVQLLFNNNWVKEFKTKPKKIINYWSCLLALVVWR